MGFFAIELNVKDWREELEEEEEEEERQRLAPQSSPQGAHPDRHHRDPLT